MLLRLDKKLTRANTHSFGIATGAGFFPLSLFVAAAVFHALISGSYCLKAEGRRELMESGFSRFIVRVLVVYVRGYTVEVMRWFYPASDEG